MSLRTPGSNSSVFTDTVEGRYLLPEIMGGGAAWLDFDLDGRLDLYLMNGAHLSRTETDNRSHSNQLYRQSSHQFESVTDVSSAGDTGYGQGVAVGDFDADGFPDLYLANYGPNRLLHNNGDGTFSEVSQFAGVADDEWSTSVAWADLDQDEMLDLYVVNYLAVTPETSKLCEYNGQPGYCGPGSYEAVPDRVYLSNGDGTFREAAQQQGLTAPDGKGLAIAMLDLDDDVQPEIYIANDMTENFLFTRTQVGSGLDESSSEQPQPFRNVAALSGCASSDTGRNEASMGVACADFDSDGLIDLYLTHYFQEKNTLYRNLGNLLFDDDSRRWKVAATSFSYLGFGVVPLDYNRDGHPDVFITNGHVLGPLQQPNEMRPQLLSNSGREFIDVSHRAGNYFQREYLGRSVASGDFDTDGDIDLLVTHLDQPVALLDNQTVAAGHFLGLDLQTRSRIRPAGARVVIESSPNRQTIPVMSGGSYLSSSDDCLLVGLGDHEASVDVTVFWPDGHVDRLQDLAVDQYLLLTEGNVPIAHPRRVPR